MIASLAQVERVTGIPEIVPIAAVVVLFVWAVLRMARRGTGELDDTAPDDDDPRNRD